MPLITGPITEDGAVVVIRVGVSGNRQLLLEKMGFPVPAPVTVRAQIDTGSFASVFQPEVFQVLGIDPFRNIFVRTPSTTPDNPYLCPQYDVSITLVATDTQVSIPSVYAISSTDFDSGEEGIQAILGRDVLNRCAFSYYGLHGQFLLAF